MDSLIELEGIGRTFGAVEALRNVSLRLKPGRIGLLGVGAACGSRQLRVGAVGRRVALGKVDLPGLLG